MEKKKVVRRVRRWIKRKYPSNLGYGVPLSKIAGPDCVVKFKRKDVIMQVVVKGSDEDISVLYDGLGRCMWYFHINPVPTYLAVPYDLSKYGITIDEVKKVINQNKAKFGLIAVRRAGGVRIICQPLDSS